MHLKFPLIYVGNRFFCGLEDLQQMGKVGQCLLVNAGVCLGPGTAPPAGDFRGKRVTPLLFSVLTELSVRTENVRGYSSLE